MLVRIAKRAASSSSAWTMSRYGGFNIPDLTLDLFQAVGVLAPQER